MDISSRPGGDDPGPHRGRVGPVPVPVAVAEDAVLPQPGVRVEDHLAGVAAGPEGGPPVPGPTHSQPAGSPICPISLLGSPAPQGLAQRISWSDHQQPCHSAPNSRSSRASREADSEDSGVPSPSMAAMGSSAPGGLGASRKVPSIRGQAPGFGKSEFAGMAHTTLLPFPWERNTWPRSANPSLIPRDGTAATILPGSTGLRHQASGRVGGSPAARVAPRRMRSTARWSKWAVSMWRLCMLGSDIRGTSSGLRVVP